MKKLCFKCSRKKPLSDFYKHPQMAGGYLGKCKACTRADVAAHREKNIEKIREYDRKRAKRPERKKNSARVSKEWRQADKRRTRAHNMAIRAIRSGKMQRKNCQVCGSSKSHAHHDNYDFPLDVIFLCAVHHKARHAELKAQGLNP